MQRSGCGGFFAVAGAVGGSYDNTDIGRIVTLSPIQAYSKLVGGVGLVTLGAAGTAEAAPAKTFATQEEVAHYWGAPLLRGDNDVMKWSGREDSNLRPLPPEGSALPG